MAELTQEQTDKAAEALWRSWGGTGQWKDWPTEQAYVRAAKAMAPFLQLQWFEPTMEEFAEIYDSVTVDGSANISRRCVKEFVRRRNAAMVPKPVDPRIAIVRHQIGGASMVHDLEGVAVKILHALDCAASQSDDHVG